jgi:hypothetical protein
MDLISKLEKRFGSWAIPNLALYIVAIQAIGVLMLLSNRADYNDLLLYGSGVMHQGQWWRLLSFLMLPSVNLGGRMFLLWLFFSFYIFIMIGRALEDQWGAFRFNLFIICGYLLTIAMAFINPGVIITNTYFLGGVFLAFATLYPNIEFRLFLILPVKVKWLAWISVGFYVMTLFSSNVGARLGVIAAFANYLLFFGKDFLTSLKAGQRRKAFVTKQADAAAQPRHTCAECGVTDKSDPVMDFRYCSTCGKCYCENHIRNHHHD